VGSGEALGDWLTQPEEGPKVSHYLLLEELAGLLTRGKWEGSTLLAFLTEAFDCPDMYEVPFRKAPIKIIEPTVSILACTTPEWFWKGMREIDIHGGFGNRFLYLTGATQEPIPMPKKPDDRLLQEVKISLNHLDQVPHGEVTLSPEALAIWKEFYKIWRETDFDPLTKAATKRIPAYILKLCLVYAALERTIPQITLDQLMAAIAVGHYAAKCTAALTGQRQSVGEEGRLEEAIRKFLRERDHTKRLLHQRLSGRVRSTTFNRVIEAMTRTGEIELLPGARSDQEILHLAGRR
jgi:HAMP domain-containing protein